MAGELREGHVGDRRAGERKECAKLCVGSDLAALDRVGQKQSRKRLRDRPDLVFGFFDSHRSWRR